VGARSFVFTEKAILTYTKPMLRLLRISSFALIDSLECDFSSGFSVLTGETGAGKSILVGALSLLSGAQAKEGFIKDGADSAELEAVFDIPHLRDHPTLGDYVEDDQLIVYRRLSRKKSSVCRLNNRTVSVKDVKTVMASVIEIVGQHAVYQLFDDQSARLFLDRFIGAEADKKREHFKESFLRLKEAQLELKSLSEEHEKRAEQERFLSLQISDIEEKAFFQDEDSQLEARLKELKVAVRMKDRLSRIDNSVGVAIEALQGSLSELQHDTGDDEFWNQFKGDAHEIVSTLNDYKAELQSTSEAYDASSETELDQVESRLQEIDAYKEKYTAHTLTELLDYCDECKVKLARLASFEDEISQLREDVDRLRQECESLAMELSNLRKTYVAGLEERITGVLGKLGFSYVNFSVLVDFSMDTLSESGADVCSFQASFNKGQEQKPLSQVASGGELSRLFLGLYTIVSSGTHCPTLVFDEVDVGVGGLTALTIGDTLKSLARKKQVFCVTHLAQIARCADHHFSVNKQEKNGVTTTSIQPLGGNETAAEIHRMVGGSDVVDALEQPLLHQ